MENNEDIKIVEELMNAVNKYGFDYDIDEEKHTSINYKEFKAIENLLSRLKTAEEEKGIYKCNYETLSEDIRAVTKDLGLPEDTIIADEMVIEIKKKFIPKQKIRDKIEELVRGKNSDWNYEYFIEGRKKEAQIQVLEELLEEEK